MLKTPGGVEDCGVVVIVGVWVGVGSVVGIEVASSGRENGELMKLVGVDKAGDGRAGDGRAAAASRA